jgi:hypothetical protein
MFIPSFLKGALDSYMLRSENFLLTFVTLPFVILHALTSTLTLLFLEFYSIFSYAVEKGGSRDAKHFSGLNPISLLQPQSLEDIGLLHFI